MLRQGSAQDGRRQTCVILFFPRARYVFTCLTLLLIRQTCHGRLYDGRVCSRSESSSNGASEQGTSDQLANDPLANDPLANEPLASDPLEDDNSNDEAPLDFTFFFFSFAPVKRICCVIIMMTMIRRMSDMSS